MPKPRNRLRRFTKFCGLALCGVILVVWFASRWWGLSVNWRVQQFDFPSVGVTQGGVYYAELNKRGWQVVPVLQLYSNATAPPSWLWSPEASPGWYVMPLWIPFLPIAALTTFLFYVDRSVRSPDSCQKCCYDLRGNTTGLCPECGHATSN